MARQSERISNTSFAPIWTQCTNWSRATRALGIDFPEAEGGHEGHGHNAAAVVVPIQVARQKIFGLGYSVLVFVYEKRDDPATRTAVLNILHTVFVEERRTADYTMTKLILKHLEAGCNAEDLIGLMHDKNLPIDDIEANEIAQELLAKPCEQGYLTISNALQWRLQYGRVIEGAGKVDGILKLK